MPYVNSLNEKALHKNIRRPGARTAIQCPATATQQTLFMLQIGFSLRASLLLIVVQAFPPALGRWSFVHKESQDRHGLNHRVVTAVTDIWEQAFDVTFDDLKLHTGKPELLQKRQHTEARFWVACSRGLVAAD